MANRIRPNLTMHDMVNAYKFSLNRKFEKNREIKKIIFNLGFENKHKKYGKKNSKKINTGSKIIVKHSNDPRSYRQNSDRIIKEGFKPQKN